MSRIVYVYAETVADNGDHKFVCETKEELQGNIDAFFANLEDDDLESRFTVYRKRMSQKEINQLPEFDGY